MWFTLEGQKSKEDIEFDKYGNLSKSNGDSDFSKLRNILRRGNHLWKNYKRYQKSVETLSNMYGCRFRMILASVDTLHLYILQQSYLGREY